MARKKPIKTLQIDAAIYEDVKKVAEHAGFSAVKLAEMILKAKIDAWKNGEPLTLDMRKDKNGEPILTIR